jgi:cell wall-associated NlpC family hydrolase
VRGLLADRAEHLADPPAGRLLATRPVAHPAAARTVRAARQVPARPVVRRSVARRVIHRIARRIVHVRHVVHRVAARAVRPARWAGARSVVAFALAQRGDPYVHGAAGPGSWDCSGLTMQAYARVGIRLPHRAALQSQRGYAVSRAQARAGDLVLWGGVGSAYHVGIYLGGGWVLHSPRPGKTVRVARLWGDPQFRRLV